MNVLLRRSQSALCALVILAFAASPAFAQGNAIARGFGR